MKKITLVLVALAFAAGVAAANDVTLSVSGSATVEWGFMGQLIDNTGSFLDASVPSGDLYSSATADSLVNSSAPAFTMTMSVSDADGNVFVEAATTSVTIGSPFAFGATYSPGFDYIRFPNVIPGVLGITLDGAGTLAPGNNTPFGSTSSNERIFVALTPIDQLSATVGLLLKTDNVLMQTYYDDVVTPAAATTGTFTWKDDGDYSDLDDFEDFTTDTLDANGWEAGTYVTFAASLEATFTQEIGEEDSISAGIGTVYDIAFFNDVYEPDYLVDTTDYTYSVFTDDALMNVALNEAVITEMYGPIAVNALSIKDMFPTLFDVTSTDEAKMLRTNQVLGRRTIPLGVNVDASIAGLTAGVDFKTALTEGNADDNFTGIIDLADETKNTINFAPYAMPMYAAVNVGYELAAGDMTVTPSVNFKYSSDYWKWGYDAVDAAWEYMGDVSGADYIGRPMSLSAGVSVDGIAGMIDVSVSAKLGLGDGTANHGFGVLSDPMGLDPVGVAATSALIGISEPSYTLTHDTGVPETIVFENTLASLMDFWWKQPTLADADTNIWTAGTDKPADSATDGQNNGFFASGASAMGISVGITATLLDDALTIGNTTAYDVDNLGIGGANGVALFGTQLNKLSNTTDVAYKWMVGDATAFTIFGNFVYTSTGYVTEMGQNYVGLRSDTADVAPDVFEFDYSEAPSMATFAYKVGIKCSVSL
jgi:hypothetical protein